MDLTGLPSSNSNTAAEMPSVGGYSGALSKIATGRKTSIEAVRGTSRESAMDFEKPRTTSLESFRSAERAGRTVCVCGASKYYERERISVQRDKSRLKEDANHIQDWARDMHYKQTQLNEQEEALQQATNQLKVQQGQIVNRTTTLRREEQRLQEEEQRLLLFSTDLDRRAQEAESQATETRILSHETNILAQETRKKEESLVLRENKAKDLEAEIETRRKELQKSEKNLSKAWEQFTVAKQRQADIQKEIDSEYAKLSEAKAALEDERTNANRRMQDLQEEEQRIITAKQHLEDVSAVNERLNKVTEKSAEELKEKQKLFDRDCQEFAAYCKRTEISITDMKRDVANEREAVAREKKKMEQEMEESRQMLIQECCQRREDLQRTEDEMKTIMEEQRNKLQRDLDEAKRDSESQVAASLAACDVEIAAQKQALEDEKTAHQRHIEIQRKWHAEETQKQLDALEVRSREIQDLRADVDERQVILENEKSKQEVWARNEHEQLESRAKILRDLQSTLDGKEADLERCKEELQLRRLEADTTTKNAEEIEQRAQRHEAKAVETREEAEQILEDVRAAEKLNSEKKRDLAQFAASLEAEKSKVEKLGEDLYYRAKILSDQEAATVWYQSLLQELKDKEEELELSKRDVDCEKQIVQRLRINLNEKINSEQKKHEQRVDEIRKLETTVQQRDRDLRRNEKLFETRLAEQAKDLKHPLVTVRSGSSTTRNNMNETSDFESGHGEEYARRSLSARTYAKGAASRRSPSAPLSARSSSGGSQKRGLYPAREARGMSQTHPGHELANAIADARCHQIKSADTGEFQENINPAEGSLHSICSQSKRVHRSTIPNLQNLETTSTTGYQLNSRRIATMPLEMLNNSGRASITSTAAMKEQEADTIPP